MTEVIWLAAVLGTIVGMAGGGIAGVALCFNCELEALLWGLAGSMVGGMVIGVAAGVFASRFAHRRSGRVPWVLLLVIASWQLVWSLLMFGPWFRLDWLHFISPVMVVAGGVLLTVLATLQAMEAFDRSG